MVLLSVLSELVASVEADCPIPQSHSPRDNHQVKRMLLNPGHIVSRYHHTLLKLGRRPQNELSQELLLLRFEVSEWLVQKNNLCIGAQGVKQAPQSRLGGELLRNSH